MARSLALLRKRRDCLNHYWKGSGALPSGDQLGAVLDLMADRRQRDGAAVERMRSPGCDAPDVLVFSRQDRPLEVL